jgi:hypothetical protein
MPQPTTLTKLVLLACAAWACTLLLYFAGIAVTAASLEQTQSATASTVTAILIAAEFLVTCISIGFIFFRSRGYQRTGVRFILIAVFTLIQFSLFVLAAFLSLVVMNR